MHSTVSQYKESERPRDGQCDKSARGGRIIIDKDKKLIVPNAGEALDGPRDNTIWVRVDIEHDQVLA